MKISLLLLFLYLCISCQEKVPKFNPFDGEIDTDAATLRKDTTLKLVGDCMAFMHVKDFGAYEVYYTVYTFSEKEDSIVGEGMNIPLEVLKLKRNLDSNLFYTDSLVRAKEEQIVDSIKQMSINISRIDSILGLFNLTRKDTFSRIEPYLRRREYFIVYADPEGKEYLFESQFEHIWLSKGVLGQRRLHFDTEVTRAILY